MAGFPLARLTQGAQRWRSFAGLAIALVMLPFVLGNDSCWVLKTPVGDPEHSRIDPRITGVWLTAEANGRLPEYEGALWLFEPYDARTWLVTLFDFKDTGIPAAPGAHDGDSPQPATSPPTPAEGRGPHVAEVAPPQTLDTVRALATLRQERVVLGELTVFKGWVANLGGRRFLVLEPRLAPSADRGFVPRAWWVLRAEPGSGRLLLYALDMGAEKLGAVEDRSRAEAIIARHAADEKFSTLVFTLYPVPRSAYDMAGAAMRRAVHAP
jgi:hypothetical protein